MITTTRFAIALTMLLTAGTFSPPARADACRTTSLVATKVMEAHQAGISMQEVLDVLNEGMSSSGRAQMRNLVARAYSETRWNSDEYKLRAVAEFRDQLTLECMRVEVLADRIEADKRRHR